MWPEERWGAGAAAMGPSLYGPPAEAHKQTLDIRPHVAGHYRVLPDSECSLTADDFTYEMDTGPTAEAIRKEVKELVLKHDHQRLTELPAVFAKFKGDEARLLSLLRQRYVDGAEEASPWSDAGGARAKLGDGGAMKHDDTDAAPTCMFLRHNDLACCECKPSSSQDFRASVRSQLPDRCVVADFPLSNATANGSWCTELAQVPAADPEHCCAECIKNSTSSSQDASPRGCTAFAFNFAQSLCYIVGAGAEHRFGHQLNCSNEGGKHCSNDTSGRLVFK